MNEIKKISVEAYEYLVVIPTKHWSRHAFPTRSKSRMLLNNCCESFNNVLREARGKPIISLMEWIRRYVMQRSAAKKKGLSNFESVLMPSVNKMIEKKCKGYIRFKGNPSGCVLSLRWMMMKSLMLST